MQKETFNTFFFFVITLLLTLAFLKLISIFLLDIIVAGILAILFTPIYKKLLEKGKGRGALASFLTVFIVLLVVVLPLVLVGFAVGSEVYGFVDVMKTSSGGLFDIKSLMAAHPVPDKIVALFDRFGLQSRLMEIGNGAAKAMLLVTQNTFIGLSKLLFNFFFVLIMVFFFLMDGDRLLRKVKSIFPIEEEAEDKVIARLKSVIDATIKGALIIAVLEGTMGGILLWVGGIPSPVILAVIMVIFSFIPVLGTNTILVPVAIYKIVTGHVALGVTILVIGLAFVAFTQNVLKPKLVGDRSGLHPLVILVSTIGGLAWFGLVGFVVGPVIAAMFLTVWDLFSLHFKKDAPKCA